MPRPRNADVVRVEFEQHRRLSRNSRSTNTTIVRRLLRHDLVGKTVRAALLQLNEEAGQDDTFSTHFPRTPCFVEKPSTERHQVGFGSLTKLDGGDKLIVTAA